ncbi:MAG: DsbA family protein [Terriglobia bacterium]
MAALVTAITAGWLYGTPKPRSQRQLQGVQCGGTAARSTNQPRPGTAANTPMTEAQGTAILNELRAIRLLLEMGAAPGTQAGRVSAPQPVRMRIDPGWHTLGSVAAPVTRVEFTDLQCPFRRGFESSTFVELKKNYIDTGKVRFFASDLPLPMHHYAALAAEAARCAGDQSKFWQFRNAVLGDQTAPTTGALLKDATELGLDLHKFQTCISKGKYRKQIEADQHAAAALGIRATRKFVIGRTKGEWVDGLLIIGTRPVTFFQQEIQQMLKDSRSESAKAGTTAEVSSTAGSGIAANR